jgi:pyridoxal 5'-phosphate synthase pdxT subunit
VSKIGVLSLQGAYRLHADVLTALDAEPVDVRTPEALSAVDALVLPGGESTTMSFLLDSSGLREPLGDALRDGMPALGTCAGMIMLATDVLDGRADQRSLGIVDIAVRRNAFGRQRESFEADLEIDGLAGGPFPAVFIRAPFVERVGDGVVVEASVGEHPVLCRSGAVTVCSFHPELSNDLRLHQRFLEGLT